MLLSALACIRNDSPISFRIACAKINSADSAPNAYSSGSPLDKATVPCPRHSLVRRIWSTYHRVQHVLFLVTGSPAQSASGYTVTCFKVLFRSFGFNACLVRVHFKHLSAFLARVKSASVGDASLYDKHFVTNIRSSLTPVMYCSFPTTTLNSEC